MKDHDTAKHLALLIIVVAFITVYVFIAISFQASREVEATDYDLKIRTLR